MIVLASSVTTARAQTDGGITGTVRQVRPVLVCPP